MFFIYCLALEPTSEKDNSADLTCEQLTLYYITLVLFMGQALTPVHEAEAKLSHLKVQKH